jgi:hypothetical protein
MIGVHVSDEYPGDVGDFERGLHQAVECTICTIEYYHQLGSRWESLRQISFPKSTARDEQLRLKIGPPPDISYVGCGKLTTTCPKLYLSIMVNLYRL